MIATDVISGGASGVAVGSFESAPSPSEFTPRTWTVYCVPLVRLPIVADPPVFDAAAPVSVHVAG